MRSRWCSRALLPIAQGAGDELSPQASLDAALDAALAAGLKPADASREVARALGLRRADVYARILERTPRG